jgi:hypothetical protein
MRHCLALLLALGCSRPAERLGQSTNALFPTTVIPICPVGDQLLTNEYATDNPGHEGIHVSPYWTVTCGSLFLRNGNAFTGTPVDGWPVADRDSLTSNNSAQFRAVTKEADFGDAKVVFNVRVNAMSVDGGSGLPDQTYDGYHVFLRYQSQYDLYAVSLARRSNTLVIKRKFPGGPFPSNGGTYYPLLREVPRATAFGRWQSVEVSCVTLADGGVQVSASLDGVEVMRAVDTGYALPDGGFVQPIYAPGRVGLRGDNTEFEFNAFQVVPLP